MVRKLDQEAVRSRETNDLDGDGAAPVGSTSGRNHGLPRRLGGSGEDGSWRCRWGVKPGQQGWQPVEHRRQRRKLRQLVGQHVGPLAGEFLVGPHDRDDVGRRRRIEPLNTALVAEEVTGELEIQGSGVVLENEHHVVEIPGSSAFDEGPELFGKQLVTERTP